MSDTLFLSSGLPLSEFILPNSYLFSYPFVCHNPLTYFHVIEGYNANKLPLGKISKSTISKVKIVFVWSHFCKL